MQPERVDLNLLHCLRKNFPLVHCITNDVVQNFTANVLLAIGASPAMIIEAKEAEQFASLTDALLINVGTLTEEKARVMLKAIISAVLAKKPWILDPVAIGFLDFRTNFCKQILHFKPAAIRGNASEILALAGINATIGKGVESTHETIHALPAAKKLACEINTIVVVTGATDYIINNQETIAVTGGSSIMSKVIGTGCTLSAAIAATCSLAGNRLNNISSICNIIKFAGTIASKLSKGPGSFPVNFIDTIYNFGNKT